MTDRSVATNRATDSRAQVVEPRSAVNYNELSVPSEQKFSVKNIHTHQNYEHNSDRGFGAHRSNAPSYIVSEGVREFVSQMDMLKSSFVHHPDSPKSVEEYAKDKRTFCNVMGIREGNNLEADFSKALRKYKEFCSQIEQRGAGRNEASHINEEIKKIEIQITANEKKLEEGDKTLKQGHLSEKAAERVSKRNSNLASGIENLRSKLYEEQAKLETIRAKNDGLLSKADVNKVGTAQLNLLKTWEENLGVRREFLPNASNDPKAQGLAGARPSTYYGEFASKLEKDTHYTELREKAEAERQQKKDAELAEKEAARYERASSAFARSNRSYPGSTPESRAAAQKELAGFSRELRDRVMNDHYAQNPLPKQSHYIVSPEMARKDAVDADVMKKHAPDVYNATRAALESVGDDIRNYEKKTTPVNFNNETSRSTQKVQADLASDLFAELKSIGQYRSSEDRAPHLEALRGKISSLSLEDSKKLLDGLESMQASGDLDVKLKSWLSDKAQKRFSQACASKVFQGIREIEMSGLDESQKQYKRENLERFVASLGGNEKASVLALVRETQGKYENGNPDNSSIAIMRKMEGVLV